MIPGTSWPLLHWIESAHSPTNLTTPKIPFPH
jgi:hypothetical protein